jgi:hypothetical protein
VLCGNFNFCNVIKHFVFKNSFIFCTIKILNCNNFLVYSYKCSTEMSFACSTLLIYFHASTCLLLGHSLNIALIWVSHYGPSPWERSHQSFWTYHALGCFIHFCEFVCRIICWPHFLYCDYVQNPTTGPEVGTCAIDNMSQNNQKENTNQ